MSQDKHQPSRLIFKSHAKPALNADHSISEEERLRAARAKAAEYRNPEPPKTSDIDKPQTLEEWRDLVSNRIEEAMRRGDFDNLRGNGKPMPVDQDAFVPEDQKMAFQMLKNNDLTPSWIAERKEMLRAIEEWREEFRRVVGQAHSAWVAASSDKRRVQIGESWDQWLGRWEAEIVEINRRINTHNLTQPIRHLEIFKLRLDDELRKVAMTRSLDK